MITGTIVTTSNLKFSSGHIDEKNDRPCIFLFEKEEENQKYGYIMPLTSKVERFNNDCDRFIFIHEEIYRYRTLSFARVDGMIRVPMDDLTSTGIVLRKQTILFLFKKIREFAVKRRTTDILDDAMLVLTSLGDTLDDEQGKMKHETKSERKARIRKIKRTNRTCAG